MKVSLSKQPRGTGVGFPRGLAGTGAWHSCRQAGIVLALMVVSICTAAANSPITIREQTEPSLYVSTDGDNTTGRDWSTAFTNLQQAIDQSVAGDTIYVRSNEFLITNSIVILGHPNLTLRGGYVGVGSGNNRQHDSRRIV